MLFPPRIAMAIFSLLRSCATVEAALVSVISGTNGTRQGLECQRGSVPGEILCLHQPRPCRGGRSKGQSVLGSSPEAILCLRSGFEAYGPSFKQSMVWYTGRDEQVYRASQSGLLEAEIRFWTGGLHQGGTAAAWRNREETILTPSCLGIFTKRSS